MHGLTSRIFLLVLGAGLIPVDLQAQEDLAPAHASGDASAPAVSDILVQVGSLVGRVTSFDDEQVVFEIPGCAGSRVVVNRDLVPADTLFRLEETLINRADPEAWMGLERFALDHGLHLRRMEALEKIAALDPSRRKQIEWDLAGCREECAFQRLQVAEELRAAGELDRAIRQLQETESSFKGCVSAKAAGDLLKQIQSDLQAERARAAGVQKERRQSREVGKELDDVQEFLNGSEGLVAEGRGKLGEYVKATRAFQKALSFAESAERKLDRQATPVTAEAGQPAGEAADVAHEYGRLRTVVRDQLVEIHVELGQIYLARGSTTTAYEHAGMGAAIDPDDGSVASLRFAIAASGPGSHLR